jgi:uncharacterized protein DUF6494
MDDATFNLEIRRFLKQFGVTAQREIERAVAEALKGGRLRGTERLKAHATLTLEPLGEVARVDGEIALG